MTFIKVEYAGGVAHLLATYGPAGAAVILLLIALPLLHWQRSALKPVVFNSLYAVVFATALVFCAVSTYHFIAGVKYRLYSWQFTKIPPKVILSDRGTRVYWSRFTPDGAELEQTYNAEFKPDDEVKEIEFYVSIDGKSYPFILPQHENYFSKSVSRFVAEYHMSNEGPFFVVRDRASGSFKRIEYIPAGLDDEPDPAAAVTNTPKTGWNALGLITPLAAQTNSGSEASPARSESPPPTLVEIQQATKVSDYKVQLAAYKALAGHYETYQSQILATIKSGGCDAQAPAALYAFALQFPVLGKPGGGGEELPAELREPVFKSLLCDSVDIRREARRALRRFVDDSTEASFATFAEEVLRTGNAKQKARLAYAAQEYYYNRGVRFWFVARDEKKPEACPSAFDAFSKSFSFRAYDQVPQDQIDFGKALFGKAALSEQILSKTVDVPDCPPATAEQVKQRFKEFLDYVRTYNVETYVYPDHVKLAEGFLAGNPVTN